MRKNLLLSLTAVLCGIVGYLLYALLMAHSDVLVARRDPAGIALTLLCFLCCIAFLVLTHGRSASAPESRGLSRKLLLFLSGVCGCFALGGMTTAYYSLLGFPFSWLILGLGLAAAAALIAYCLLPSRLKDARTLCMGVVCLFFVLKVLCSFKLYGGDPQVFFHIMTLLAELNLMVFTYHAAENTCKGSGQKNYAFWRMLGIFFSIIACVRGGIPYAAAAGFLLLSSPIEPVQ